MDGVFSKKGAPEPKRNPFSAENEKLRRQNQRLQEELRKAEIVIDVQKSGHAVGSAAAAGSGQREVLMAEVEELRSVVGSAKGTDSELVGEKIS